MRHGRAPAQAIARLIMVLFPAIVSAACATSPPMRYYTLDPVPGAGSSIATRAMVEPPVWIREVTLPAQLDRPQIVRRNGPYRVEFSDLERWAAPLGTQVTSVLARDLAQRMGPGEVIAPGQPLPAGDLRSLTISVLAFESDTQGHVVLVAGWAVQRGTPSRVVVRRTARVAIQGASGDPGAVAAAMSQALGQLADRIDASLSASYGVPGNG